MWAQALKWEPSFTAANSSEAGLLNRDPAGGWVGRSAARLVGPDTRGGMNPRSRIALNFLPRFHGIAAILVAIAALPAALPAIAQTAKPVTITVHADQGNRPYTPIWNFFGADEPNFTYAANGQKLLHELSALSPVPVYFRPHNLLTPATAPARSSGVRPTPTPRGQTARQSTTGPSPTASSTPSPQRMCVRWSRSASCPRRSPRIPSPIATPFQGRDLYRLGLPSQGLEKWGKLVHAYAEYLHQRSALPLRLDGELWNEPDIGYWQGTPEEYDHLYDVSANAIRQVLPQARVGGPESTGVGSDRAEAFLRQFLEHCSHGHNAATGGTGEPLDFISFHPKGQPTTVEGPKGNSPQGIRNQLRAIDRGLRVVASYPEFRATPILLGESDPEGCAACKGPSNAYRNGPLYGVSVARSHHAHLRARRQVPPQD